MSQWDFLMELAKTQGVNLLVFVVFLVFVVVRYIRPILKQLLVINDKYDNSKIVFEMEVLRKDFREQEVVYVEHFEELFKVLQRMEVGLLRQIIYNEAFPKDERIHASIMYLKSGANGVTKRYIEEELAVAAGDLKAPSENVLRDQEVIDILESQLEKIAVERERLESESGSGRGRDR